MIKGGLTALLFLGLACAKTGGSTSKPAPPADTAALPGTVAKTDTLTIMAYNVLNYGDYCQGFPATLDGYLRTIVQYAQPDLMSCEKMYAFATTPGAAGNLADEITDSVLNKDFPGRYAYCTPTDISGASDMSTLFYNKQKLTYVRTETLVNDITDFDLYTLYYNDVNLHLTHDTTFLYVLVNHTQSGNSSTDRDGQVTAEMQALRSRFSYFPNLIDMGDFNTASSLEAGYQSVISPADSSTMMSDPPYFPDRKVQYPGNWDVSPNLVLPYLTTSTRLSATVPNSCGTSGGAKGWYDHIFLSPWLVSGANYMEYIPGSYQAIGNDGNRLGVDINSTAPVVNTSAPAAVINALWEFSNKYPVMVKVAIRANRNANSPADPVDKP